MKKPLSMQVIAIAITTGILAFALALNSTVHELFFVREYVDLLADKLHGTAETLAAQLNHLLALGLKLEELVGFEEQCTELVARHKVAYAVVVDRNGRVLFHGGLLPVGPLPVPESDTLTKHPKMYLLRVGKEHFYHLAVPIHAPGGEYIGAVMVGYPARLLRAKKVYFALSSAAVAAFSFLVAVGLLVFIGDLFVARPWRQLVAEIEAAGKERGSRPPSLNITGSEEIVRLAGAFRDLLTDLFASRAALEEQAKTLQKIVEERTRELKEANAALVRRAEELARSNAELEQFASVVSHDLKEPLRMITGYLQLLARRYQGRLDADADEFIGYAVDGARRLDALINALLTYARAGTSTRPIAPTDLEEVLDEALANLRRMIAENSAIVERKTRLPVVMADRIQLVQVFQNLIANAIKFRRPEEPPRITVEAVREENYWHLIIQDNGLGFAPEEAEKIFLLFHRLHNQDRPGFGIGLAVCKKIVERHGGRIWAESTPGEGATFHFTLPAAAAEEAPIERK